MHAGGSSVPAASVWRTETRQQLTMNSAAKIPNTRMLVYSVRAMVDELTDEFKFRARVGGWAIGAAFRGDDAWSAWRNLPSHVFVFLDFCGLITAFERRRRRRQKTTPANDAPRPQTMPSRIVPRICALGPFSPSCRATANCYSAASQRV